MLLGTKFLDIVFGLFNRSQLGIDLRIDLGDDRFEIQEQHDPAFHLDDPDDPGLIPHLRRRFHLFP